MSMKKFLACMLTTQILLLLCASASANVREFNEILSKPDQQIILSGAFDVTYEFSIESITGSIGLKAFVRDEKLRESARIIIDLEHFLSSYTKPVNVKVNIIRPEANEKYILCKLFVDGADIFENVDMKRYGVMRLIAGKKYYYGTRRKETKDKAENYAVYLGEIRNVKLSRVKFSGTCGYDKAPSMLGMFEERSAALKNSIIRKAIALSLIIALSIIMIMIGRLNLVHFIGGFASTYIAAIGVISLLNNYLPKFYNIMMSMYLYLINNFGVEAVKDFKPYEVDLFLCVFTSGLLLYFIVSSKRELLSLILLPVVIILQIFILMFTFNSVINILYYAFAAFLIFSLFNDRSVKSGKSGPNYDRQNSAGPDFSGMYYADGVRWYYSYDTVYNGNRRVYVENDEGNSKELMVDMNGFLYDEDGTIYYKSKGAKNNRSPGKNKTAAYYIALCFGGYADFFVGFILALLCNFNCEDSVLVGGFRTFGVCFSWELYNAFNFSVASLSSEVVFIFAAFFSFRFLLC